MPTFQIKTKKMSKNISRFSLIPGRIFFRIEFKISNFNFVGWSKVLALHLSDFDSLICVIRFPKLTILQLYVWT
jgi:hypothetical protein